MLCIFKAELAQYALSWQTSTNAENMNTSIHRFLDRAAKLAEKQQATIVSFLEGLSLAEL